MRMHPFHLSNAFRSASLLLGWLPIGLWAQDVQINEIYFSPPNPTVHLEFIELHNAGATAVDVSDWVLEGGVDVRLPAGTSIPAGGYLVLADNPTTLTAEFAPGVPVIGPWVGQLSSDGETLRLRDAGYVLQDKVKYAFAGEWPYASGDAQHLSLQRISAAVDNDQPGAWRADVESAGAANNSVLMANTPPMIEAIRHRPETPVSGQPVKVTARIADPDGIQTAELLIQVVDPGSYIELGDPAYNTTWTSIAMRDDGTLGDATAGDGEFTAEVPASYQQHRRLIRYRVQASDTAGQSLLLPYASSVEPNFAWFVSNGLTPYLGPSGTSFDFSTMAQDNIRPLYLLAKAPDVEYLIYQYTGRDCPSTGTVVYDGKVHDHICYRNRGNGQRNARGKRNIKLNFNKGNRIHLKDHEGRPMNVEWDKIKLNSMSYRNVQESNYVNRGNHGLQETVSHRMFNLMDHASARTTYFHLRVIDEAAETTADPHVGDFWGLYLGFEDFDGSFLDEHEWPDGNIYRRYKEKKNQGRNSVTDTSDLDTFYADFTNGDETWWRNNLEMPTYFRYLSVYESIAELNNFTPHPNKHLTIYYRSEATWKWTRFPDDLEAAWIDWEVHRNVNYPFKAQLRAIPALKVELQNEVRHIRDLLFNEEQMHTMIDEHASYLWDANDPISFVDAEEDLWNNHPRNTHGPYYPYSADGEFEGEIQRMKNFVIGRLPYMDTTVLDDANQPVTPSITWNGPAGYPVDNLQLTSSAFADPNGNSTFDAFTWRIAEVTDAANPIYDPADPIIYEIDAVWTGAVVTTFTTTHTLPGHNLKPGHSYRARLRYRDTSNRWSHWSDPLAFVAGAPQAPPPAGIVINEIMYNPDEATCGNEYIELYNTSASAISLAGYHFADGIDFTFAETDVLAPGAYLVLADNAQRFEHKYGVPPFGQYDGKLRNSGETIELLGPYDSPVDLVDFDDNSPWPEAADGAGAALELIAPSFDNNIASSWAASTACGTPGLPNSVGCPTAAAPIVINEIHYRPDWPADFAALDTGDWIELYNPGAAAIDLSNWSLTMGSQSWTIAAGTTIPAGDYTLLASNSLSFSAAYPDANNVAALPGLALDNGGATLQLFDASGCAADALAYNDKAPWPTAPDGNGPALALLTPNMENALAASWVSSENYGGTPGTANLIAPCAPAPSAIIINEVNYHSNPGANAGDWIELHNPGGASVDLSGWLFVTGSGAFTIPNGSSIAANGFLILASNLGQFAAQYPGVAPLIGPIGFDLSDSGEPLGLFSADRCLIDWLEYDDAPPWRNLADGQGPTLSLMAPGLDNTKPWNWMDDAPTPGQANAIADPCNPAPPQIVINEIRMAGPSFSQDWIELHNPSATTVSLANWSFFDEGSYHVLSPGAILGPGGYLIVAQNLFAFQSAWPGIPAVGSTGFGLSRSGENLWLVSDSGCLVDHVQYADAAPWPNNSEIMALVDPAADNALAVNWAEANQQPTPGAANQFRPAPGGVDNDLFLWFAGDDGLAANGWIDRSGKTNDALIVSAAATPSLANASINGHDTLLFNGNKTLSLGDLPAGNKTFFAVLQGSEHESWIRWQDTNDFLRLDDAGQIRHGQNGSVLNSGLVDGPAWQLASVEMDIGQTNGVVSRVDGFLEDSTTWLDPVRTITGGYIGSRGGLDPFYNGQIAEIIGYDQAASPAELQQVLSYLSIKYGLTIPVSEHLHYAHTSHPDHLAGLGIDGRSLLVQTSGRSVKTDSILTMHTASDLDQGEFLAWGSDGASPALAAFGIPPFLADPLGRTWRISHHGAAGTVSLSFDLAGLGISLADAEQFNLLIDTDDGDFSNAMIHQTGRSIAGTVVTFTDVVLPDGAWLALSTVQHIQTVALGGPGNITRPEMQAMNEAITDPTGAGGMIFNLVSGPPGLTLSPAGQLVWTPSEAQGPGAYSLEVFGSDSSGPILREGSYTMSITVAEANRAPTLATAGPFSTDEHVPVTFAVSGSDPDLPANILSYVLVSGPAGSSVTPTGQFAWTPGENDGGSTVPVIIRVLDDGNPQLSGVQTYQISVAEINRPPVITPVADPTIPEQVPWSHSLVATDPDLPANTLTWTLVSGPAGAVLQPNGTLSWTPSEAHGPGTWPITVRVTDNGSPVRTATSSFTLSVTEANRAPSIASIPAQNATEHQLFQLQIRGSDPDLPANTLLYTLISGPTGSSVTPSGLFRWTPGEGDGGTTASVTVRVMDDALPALNADRSFQISVAEVNATPVITPVAAQTIPEQVAWTYSLNVTDSDLPANALTWTLLAEPTGLALSANGAITWTPSELQGPGTYTVQARVTDNGSPNRSATISLQVTVSEENRPPAMASLPPQSATEHQPFLVTLSGSDPDLPANGLSFALVSAPSGAAITPAGLFSWTPDESQGGIPVQVRVRLTDTGTPPLSSESVFNIGVAEVNATPTLAAIPDQSIAEYDTWSQTLSASDSDLPPQALQFQLLQGPSGMSLDTAAGSLEWIPDESHGPGVYTTVVQVADNGLPPLSEHRTFVLTVSDANSAPVFAAIGPQALLEHELFVLDATATDLDSPAQVLTWSLGPGAPSGIRIDPTSGRLSWLPNDLQDGAHSVEVIARDDQAPAGESRSNLSLVVAERNLPPILYAGTPCTEETTLFAAGSPWLYRAAAGDPNPNWTEPWFVPSTWSAGVAQFGFGDADETTVIPIGFLTYYFRSTFTATDVGALSSLIIELQRDDGAIVYLNGREVIRDNMPAGPVTYATQASTSAFGIQERTFFPFNIDPGFLVEGLNTIAVEVHQRTANSNDLSFDLRARTQRIHDCGRTNVTLIGHTLNETITHIEPDISQGGSSGLSGPASAQLFANGLLIFTPTAADVGLQTLTVNRVDTGSPTATGTLPLKVLVHPDMRIQDKMLHRSGKIHWPTLPGLNYVVEYCDDLTIGTWTTLTTAIGSATPIEITDPVMDPAHPHINRCYRIRLLP